MTANTEPDSTETAARISSGQKAAPLCADGPQFEERPEALARGPITLYSRDGHRIWAELSAEGHVVINGQDLRPPNGWEEYEYAFTIFPEDLPLIEAALKGAQDDSVLHLLAANAERIVPGVKSWLDAGGVRYEFWDRIEPGHR